MTFDPLAHDYDQRFTHTRTGAWLRDRTRRRMAALWQAGDQVLELGCGTGEDALWLATARGVHVLATDASPAMLAVARGKLTDSAGDRLAHALLDLNALPADGFREPVNGVLANFGVLNCVDDLPGLARWLAHRVKPGGWLAFAVMSPWCVWEIAWYAAHLDFRTATRRLRPDTVFQGIRVHYPAPRALTAAFAPYFRRVYLGGLGVFLPPSEMYPVVEKRPRLWDRLATWEARHAGRSWLARYADHYWLELQRTLH